MRNAKIVCTLGPASESRDVIRGLVRAGMSVARLNASHGDPDDRAAIVERVRAVGTETETAVATMLDLPGPEVRTAPLDDPITLATGSTVRFVEGDTATPEEIGVSSSLGALEPGDTVLLDDGRIETTVESVDRADGGSASGAEGGLASGADDVVTARVESGGALGGRKGVNTPGVDLGLDVITEDDERELDVAAEAGVDFVAASFVRDAADVFTISEALEERGVEIPVIAKIERADAVENLAEIIDAAYGVMVARGDLGVECPLEQVPLIQKRTIRRCRESGTPVITATEMLDSMVHARRPTRAEAADVANAVLDGTDAVMLSAETAVGDHPIRVVETMARIVRDVESSEEYRESLESRVPAAGDTQTDALARSARFLARDVGAAAVVAASESGYTALKAAKYRPTTPVVASTPSDEVCRRLALSWGVIPRRTDIVRDGADAVIQTAVQSALDTGAARSGDTVVVLSGMMTDLEGTDTTNLLKVHVAAEIVTSGRGVAGGRVAGPIYRRDDGDLTDLPDDCLVALTPAFDDEFDGDLDRLAGIVDARPGMTGYAAVVARELGIPMVGDATLPDRIADGDTVTIDAERGVVYDGDVVRDRDR